MTKCKSKDVTTRFVRDLKAAPEPALVLATDQQLDDLVQFSTKVEEFCVVTVDPTFNLGTFEVTPLTYHYWLLLGPILLHFCKNSSTLLYIDSTLVELQCNL